LAPGFALSPRNCLHLGDLASSRVTWLSHGACCRRGAFVAALSPDFAWYRRRVRRRPIPRFTTRVHTAKDDSNDRQDISSSTARDTSTPDEARREQHRRDTRLVARLMPASCRYRAHRASRASMYSSKPCTPVNRLHVVQGRGHAETSRSSRSCRSTSPSAACAAHELLARRS
jgi:hypothetical protein